jgi:transposase
VLAGNTLDQQTLTDAVAKIEAQYGKAERIWLMDRGIPTEETLALMRASDPPVHDLVGTPKGRLTKLEKSFLTQPWAAVGDQVMVKFPEQDGEL